MKLADHGVAEAARELGVMYYNGLGVPQEYAQAGMLYRLAAEQGLTGAQHGVMCLKGQGVPQNYVLAHMWSNLAASHIPSLKKADHDP